MGSGGRKGGSRSGATARGFGSRATARSPASSRSCACTAARGGARLPRAARRSWPRPGGASSSTTSSAAAARRSSRRTRRSGRSGCSSRSWPAVREALGLERVHLFGSSWGGMLAMEYALTRPPGLASLIVASSPASITQWVGEANRLRAELPPEVQETLLRHEEAGTTDDPAYEEACRRVLRAPCLPVVPFPECVMRSFDADREPGLPDDERPERVPRHRCAQATGTSAGGSARSTYRRS